MIIMLRFISIPSFLIFFFSLFLILYSTHGISFPFNSSLQPDGVKSIVDKQVDEELSWMAWRSLVVEGVHENTTFVLAQERTLRKDVFNHFKRYTGGWNISNPEYISSVLSTAVPFFVVAATWLVVFGLVLHIICVCYCCCPRDPHGFSQLVCYATFIFLILCTIVAIGGCVVLYTSEQQFHGTTSNTIKYIVSQAEFTIENLKNVTNYLDSAKMMAIEFGLPDDVDEEIDSVKKKIIDVAADISIKTHNNSQMLHNSIHGMRLALIIIVTSMLIVLVLGFFTSILRLKYTLYSLVFAGWVLVAGTFILCGAFVFLHDAIGDTCVAMDEWVLNPTAHTSLDEILPCIEIESTHETFLQSKSVIYSLANSINGFISIILNGNSMSHNQSAPSMPLLCNPFNSDFTVRDCAAGEVAFENATEVWKNYTCQVSPLDNYGTTGCMAPYLYTQLATAVEVAYGLYHYGPFLVDLMDCTFVRKMFVDINNNYCPGLERCTKYIYWGSNVVSVAAVLSLVFWIVYERQLHHRNYIKQS